MDKFRAHCKFELFKKKYMAQIVEPDTFVIHRSNFDTFGTNAAPATYASLELAGLMHTDAGLSNVDFVVFLYLKSETQKNVFRLSCLNWDDPRDGRYLTVNEIRRTLGSIMTLYINDPAAKPLKPADPVDQGTLFIPKT